MPEPRAAKPQDHNNASRFDRFVEGAHAKVSRAPFFIFCVMIIVVWMASYPLFHDAKAWQYVIHIVGRVITMLLVVLLVISGVRDAYA